MKISWVTIDRVCQEEADAKENVRRKLEHTGKPLRSSADSLSDDELLTKLRSFGLDVDRDGVERLCAGALSAQEVAAPIVDKLKLGDEPGVDWVWISLLALWQTEVYGDYTTALQILSGYLRSQGETFLVGSGSPILVGQRAALEDLQVMPGDVHDVYRWLTRSRDQQRLPCERVHGPARRVLGHLGFDLILQVDSGHLG